MERYLDAGVNVVELHLLRLTRTGLEVTEDDIPAEQRTSYYACIHRATDPGRWEAYPISLRHPIPPIPVPLRETDADVMLELQPILARVSTTREPTTTSITGCRRRHGCRATTRRNY